MVDPVDLAARGRKRTGDDEVGSDMSDVPSALFQRWVHSMEEDTSQAEIYRPAGFSFPLGRQPRRSMEFRPDGTYIEYRPGAADQSVPHRGSWQVRAGAIVASIADAPQPTRILSCDRTVLRVSRG